MKHRITRFVVTTLLVVIGLGMISYPYISNRLYEDQQSELIRSYQEETDSLDDGMLAQEIEKSRGISGEAIEKIEEIKNIADEILD